MKYPTDNTIKLTLTAFVVSAMLFFSGTIALAQQAEGEAMPELTLEQKKDRLEMNINAMFAVFIQYGKMNEQSVESIGKFLGREFGSRWPEDLTPLGLVEGMNRNWQMHDITTELLESTPDYVEGRHTIGYEDEWFNNVYGEWASFDEYQEFFRAIIQGIAGYHGLTYDEHREDDWIYFTVARQSD